MKHTFLKVLMVALYAKVVASDYQELFFDVKLDHNSPHNKHAGSDGFDDMAFQMRYLVDDTYFSDPFNKDKLRPILFYAGNEGDITGFYNNSGFITTTLAEQWGGLVVFGEHRYFGQSYPFDKDEAFKVGNNAFLTVENVMMDYVQLIKQIKVAYNATDKAVMVFGGSYGGMLASWMRMKFPQHFQGALASSAPILYFKDSPDVPEDAFSLVATQDYAETFPDQRCSKGIKEGF